MYVYQGKYTEKKIFTLLFLALLELSRSEKKLNFFNLVRNSVLLPFKEKYFLKIFFLPFSLLLLLGNHYKINAHLIKP
jgi:hypothetical protein